MFCPECGHDAADAKFCPECGTELDGVRGAVGRGRTTGSAARRGSGGGRAAKQAAGTPAPAGRGVQRPASSSTNPLVLWIVIGIVALIVVVAVVLTQGSSDSSDAGSGTVPQASGPAPALSEVDTTGSYDELVARGNGYYDAGVPYVQNDQLPEAAPWFAAAAKVYRAAWKKQPGDPAVGTDYATSLFYAAQGPDDVEAAIAQIDEVIAKSPDFQNARFNKGNYLAMLARMLEQQGDAAKAKDLYAEARSEYQAAVEIDPQSASGQAAAQALESL